MSPADSAGEHSGALDPWGTQSLDGRDKNCHIIAVPQQRRLDMKSCLRLVIMAANLRVLTSLVVAGTRGLRFEARAFASGGGKGRPARRRATPTMALWGGGAPQRRARRARAPARDPPEI